MTEQWFTGTLNHNQKKKKKNLKEDYVPHHTSLKERSNLHFEKYSHPTSRKNDKRPLSIPSSVHLLFIPPEIDSESFNKV